jgi:hypothetical protein
MNNNPSVIVTDIADRDRSVEQARLTSAMGAFA